MTTSRNVLGLIAGQASIVAILLLMLALGIAGAPLLQQKKVVATRLGADVAVTKARAISEALLADVGERSLNVNGSEFVARHLEHALAEPATSAASAEEVVERAVTALRTDPSRPFVHFRAVAESPHLFYAVADRRGGIVLLDLPLDRERATIGRFFGQTYLSNSYAAYVLIALLMFAGFGLRYYLRGLIKLPDDQRREAVLKGLGGNFGNRRNLLPWLLALCAGIFAADVANLLDSAIGICYLFAVVLGLSSNRHWHISVITVVSAVLMMLSPIFSPYDNGWWTHLESHSASIFAIFATGLFGSAHLRKSRAEALALAEAVRSRNETSELRGALERAEAAETENRRMVDRMRMANESAGVSVWEWNIKDDITRVEGGPFVERIGGRTEFKGTDYAN
ncbi:MAG: hypothetical protein ACREUC_09095, partial [Steroidobacteraceae bacterium]